MRWIPRALVLAAALASAGCPDDTTTTPTSDTADATADADTDAADSDDADSGPDVPLPDGVFEGTPVTGATELSGMTSPVSVVTDQRGIPHIYATTAEDLMFALGYVHARDRLAQMELVRRSARGRLAELLGASEPGLIRDDIVAKLYGFERVAQQMYDGLPTDSLQRRGLDAYALGVNAWLARLRSGEVALPSPLDLFLPPEIIEDWTPVDSLSMGRLQAFELGFDSDHEVGLTERYQKIRAAFPPGDANPALAFRAGWVGDVYGWSPPDQTVQYESYDPDLSGGLMNGLVLASPKSDARRPQVPEYVFARARQARRRFRMMTEPGQRGASNSWAVGPSLTASGHAIVCNDPHLSLDNPPLFYFAHLVLDESSPDGPIDAIGGNFPGIPGFLIGHNERVAWALTTAADDRSDAYLEQFTAGAGGAAPQVLVNGVPEDVTVIEGEITVGSLGEVTGTVPYQVHITPQGRVLVPEIDQDGTKPLETGAQLSYAWIGFEPTPEFDSILGALTASSVDELLAIYSDFFTANQNVVFGDVDGNIAGLSPGAVPVREAGAMAWDPDTNPEGAAPWWILPGDGGAEWLGLLPKDQGPQAKNPAKGFVVTANNDHFGQTLDDNPLNEDVYVGYEYAMGFRAGRITRLIDGTGPGSPAAGGAKLDQADLVAIQGDVYSNLAERLRARLLADLQPLADTIAAPGTHPELDAILTAWGGDTASIGDIVGRLTDWNGVAESGFAERDVTPTAAQREAAVATTYWNVWLVRLIERAFDDELAVIGVGPSTNFMTRGIVRIVENAPGDVKTLDPVSGESILWDDIGTEGVQETRSEIIASALLDALDTVPTLFPDGTPVADQVWGDLHRLKFDSLLPVPGGSLDIPSPQDDIDPRGFARPGDQFAVNVCNPGVTDTSFNCGSGPMLRMCVELDPAGVRTTQMIPGGQVMAKSSPHYRDWLDDWLDHEPVFWAFHAPDVAAQAEAHLVLQPAP